MNSLRSLLQKSSFKSCLLVAVFGWAGATANAFSESRPPDWARDVVWYQIFPERFRDGDSSNNPERTSLEWPIMPSERWRISPWTGDWYARDEWEKELDGAADKDHTLAFYKAGVFDRRYGG
jgi:hypothetical protein